VFDQLKRVKEGFMHCVPAVVFGKADFHHIAKTVQINDDVVATLDWARDHGPALPYAANLHWRCALP